MSLGERVFFKRQRGREVPLKGFYFTASGSSNVKTVKDKHKSTVHPNKHWQSAFTIINIDDLKRS